jgi:hypothetical protein
MPFSESTTPKLLAPDIAAFSDAELDQYLEENRRPDGSTVVDVDWKSLPKDQLDSLIQRLR